MERHVLVKCLAHIQFLDCIREHFHLGNVMMNVVHIVYGLQPDRQAAACCVGPCVHFLIR